MSSTKEKILSTNNRDYSPYQSESYNKAVENVKQNAINKAEENSEETKFSVRKVKDKENAKTLFNSVMGYYPKEDNNLEGTATGNNGNKAENKNCSGSNCSLTESNNSNLSYSDMLKKFREEQDADAEKLAKKERREMIFSKLTDGISAIANLIATTKGAQNSFTGENTRTENTRKKWEEFYKKQKEEGRQIYEDQMRALKLEEDLKYRKEKDEEEKRRYEEGIEWRNQQAQKSEERYNKEQENRKARQEEEDRRWQETFNEGKRRHDENIKVQNDRIDAAKAKGVRGKAIGFVDGNGNQVSIYENVWKGSMQQVFDAMVNEGVGRGVLSETRWNNKISAMTPSEKEDYVKQNWHKSPKASQIMLTLSTIDPATMTSEINSEGEIEIYTPNSNNDEDVIVYVPGKK